MLCRIQCLYQHGQTVALKRVTEVPGVLIRRVELTPHSFAHNGMASAALAPAPPPLGPDPAA
jgi:hypothetical protein